ncbi:MAG: ribonuclease Z, partial [Clostridia bacterium]|nr:ribonuclease Z [Clostridia bacterium]
GSGILIDCGEGTQIALKEAGITMKPIDILCFTHYHADHVSGLPGFLLTMGNEGRTEPLNVIGPRGLEAVLRGLLVIGAPAFPIRIYEYDGDAVAPITIGDYEITPFPLAHGVPCYGYRISIARAGKFDPEKARQNGVPVTAWNRLQKGEAVEDASGEIYTPDMVLGPPRRGISVTYATDTRPVPVIAEMARDGDLLVCEGMFGDPEKLGRAVEAGHMLFREAATLAREAGVARLWLTHYSPSMKEPEAFFASEAAAIFPDSVLGFDGMRETVRFRED